VEEGQSGSHRAIKWSQGQYRKGSKAWQSREEGKGRRVKGQSNNSRKTVNKQQ